MAGQFEARISGPGPALTEPAAAAVSAALAREGAQPGALLPVLQAVQERLGHVPAAAVPAIARALNLARAEVHGVLGFYHDFRATPPGRHVLRVCRAEACQAQGGQALQQHLEQSLGVVPGSTSADGAVTLESVYCLGNCACAPALQLDGALHGRVTPAVADALLAACREPA